MRGRSLFGIRRVAGIVAIVAIAAAGCSKGSDEHRVVLEANTAAGANPFTTTVDYTAVPPSTAPATIPPATTTAPGAIRRVSGVAPGLYGGTQDKASCDVEQMISFLGDPANAAKAKAWADAEGITVAQIPDYLHTLTPVVLRVDTRVTNHGFKHGKANPLQSVLQAGTAVLVDRNGVPRAKCNCGNPLQPPAGALTQATYEGQQWSTFKPAQVAAVVPGQPVNTFVLVDTTTGETFKRPVGGNGATDTANVTAPRPEDKVYEGTGYGWVDFASDVPFVLTSTNKLTQNLSYVIPSAGSILMKEGTYNGVAVWAEEGQPWRVVIRPMAKVHEYTGTGDTDLGTQTGPTFVVVDLRPAAGDAHPGDFYLHRQDGVMSSFTALATRGLVNLGVSDQQHAGWRLDIWALPSGCSELNGTDQSVQCSA
jgi:hypothetical protein